MLQGDWYQAMQYCDYINMQLVSIETAGENKYLFQAIASFGT